MTGGRLEHLERHASPPAWRNDEQTLDEFVRLFRREALVEVVEFLHGKALFHLDVLRSK
jgi:hypothetical protein